MKRKLILLLTLCIGLTAWAQHLKVEHLAGNNCMIRISPDATEKYLLLPVEEKAPESSVRIIVDNVLVNVINVRLAKDHIDYFVPMELDEYHGRHLVLAAKVAGDPRHTQDACWSNISLSDSYDTKNTERWRPAYHHTPVYGWMNDPNGMFYLNGEWHLYYQYGPYGSMWNNMTWGHSVSKDFIHWEHRKPAIWGDAHGAIFSGSCVVDHNNTAGFGKGAIIALYTSAADVQCQSLAYSTDGGNTFKKYEGNPILTADIPDFRDPNMFWNEDIKAWNLVLACGQEMRIYSSPNLKDWKEESRFGHGYGNHGGVWECPDLLKVPYMENGKMVNGKSKWVLICNINPGGPFGGSATQYFVGDFDGHSFKCEDEAYETKWMDFGKDHYATVSFSNAPEGRATVLAWMSNWEYANDVPTKQFRSANSVARDLFLYDANGETYVGSRPSPEYDGKGLDKTIKVKGSCTVTCSNKEGDKFTIVYDEKNMQLTVSRTESGLTSFAPTFPAVTTAPVHRKLTSLRLFIDNSSVEVFGNNGEVVLTNLVFPKSKLDKITVK